MPNPVMDAMADGKAVVATRVGVVPDMINHKVDGFLYEPKNGKGLLVCSVQIVGDRRLRLRYGERARARALKCHDITGAFPKILTVIDAAVDNEKGPVEGL